MTGTQFKDLGLDQALLRVLDELGFQRPTRIQAEAIPAALAGRDLIAAARTGTGKTAAFGLPLLQRLAEGPLPAANSIRALVLVPTRELAQQVADSLREHGRNVRLRVVFAYGGVSLNPQMMALRRGADILVATPGRLLDLHGKHAVRFGQLQMLVLDEADRMLDLGFSRELDQIIGLLPRRRQTLLFSATFSDEIRTLAAGLLHDPLQIDASPRNTTVSGVKQWVVPVDKQRKLELFRHLLRKRRWTRVLVFARTRKRVDELVTSLGFGGVSCGAIHGDITQSTRLATLRRFEAGELHVLVATDVAARGLDITALPVVVNLDLPVAPEAYVHRIGRTARAGESGEALSLVCADEAPLLVAIEALIGKTLPRREVGGFEPRHCVPATVSGKGKGKPTAQSTKGPKGARRSKRGDFSSRKSRPGR